ncbi:MAG: ferritin family protein [Planctomycetota bacterium]
MSELTPEVIKAIETAIAAERQGAKVYLDLARKTSDPTGKNMLISLASDEFEHLIIFINQLDAARNQGMLLEVKVKESEIAQLQPKLRNYRTEKSSEGTNELGALRTAMDQERSAIEFYNEQQEITNDPAAKKMYIELVEIEQSHYDLLQAQIDYINKTGYWFDIPEFRLEVE